jgi:hypothetical protein
MPVQTRKNELERCLEQSRRLLRSISDATTCDRLGRLIVSLEHEQELEKEK